MTIGFADIVIGNLRLTLLRVLNEATMHEANSSVLHQAVEAMGIRVTRDQVRTELGWLQEQRCVKLIELSPILFVATLTERGGDVAKGRSKIAGIPQPSPGSGQ